LRTEDNTTILIIAPIIVDGWTRCMCTYERLLQEHPSFPRTLCQSFARRWCQDLVHDNVEEEDEEEHPQSDNVVHNLHKSIRALSPKITSY